MARFGACDGTVPRSRDDTRRLGAGAAGAGTKAPSSWAIMLESPIGHQSRRQGAVSRGETHMAMAHRTHARSVPRTLRPAVGAPLCTLTLTLR